jgi:hypothetical protein
LAQVSENHDLKTLAQALGHLDWDTKMNIEEYHCLMENDTWDLVPLLKGIKIVRCKCAYRTKYASYGSFERHKAWFVSKDSLKLNEFSIVDMWL